MTHLASRKFVAGIGYLILLLNLAGILYGQSEIPKSSYDGQPVWSPDGNLIAFVSDRAGSHDIWIMDSQGGNLVNLTPGLRDSIELFPKWSPNGDSILFLSDSEDEFDILVAAVDTGIVLNLTSGINESVGWPVWSPNGEFIAFGVSEGMLRNNISMIRNDGTGLIALTEGRNDYGFPQWMPDGHSILFESFQLDNHGLFLMTLDDNSVKKLLLDSGVGFTLSPQGDYIVFTTPENGDLIRRNIWLLEFGAPELRNINYGASYYLVEDLSWSPDGSKILFTSKCDDQMGNDGIFLVDLEEENLVTLIGCHQGNNAFPKWSPDGKSIVFQSDRDGTADVWVMNSDGSRQINLTANKNLAAR